MNMVEQERRRTRSDELVVSLRLALQAVARDFELSHLVLCDDGGLVYAGIGWRDDLDAIAAFSPMLHRAVDSATQARVLEALGDHVFEALPGRVVVRSFECCGTTFLMCGIGTQGAAKDVGVYRAITASRRILTA